MTSYFFLCGAVGGVGEGGDGPTKLNKGIVGQGHIVLARGADGNGWIYLFFVYHFSSFSISLWRRLDIE